MQTERDIHEIYSMDSPYDAIEVITHDGANVVSADCVKTEWVRGRRFRRHSGEDVVLGLSSQAQQALQMREEAFDNLQRDNDDLSRDIRHQIKRINDIHQAGLWQRIKWVFTGLN